MHMLAYGSERADTSHAFGLAESIPSKYSILTAVMSHPLTPVPLRLPVACYPCPDVIIFIISVALTAARLTSWHLISFSQGLTLKV